MSTRSLVWLLCFLTLSGCASARARREAATGIREGTIGLTTLQDRPLRLAFLAALHADCTSSGDAIVQVTEPPTYGKTAVSAVKDYTNFTNDNQRAACNKEKRAGLDFVYRPNAGFSGTDRVVADVIWPEGLVNRVTYNITVR